jgi:hypothetical protein
MQEKPLLITDVDSVLLDWLRGFINFLNIKGICTKHVDHHLGTTMFIKPNIITNIKCESTNNELFNEFMSGQYIQELQPLQKGTPIHMRELSKHFEIVALTCIGTEKSLVEKRNLNLINVYCDIFKEIICLDFGVSKEPYLKHFNDNYNVHSFIDDRIDHISESISAGIPPILFARGVTPDTLNNSNFRTMSCFEKIKNILISEI